MNLLLLGPPNVTLREYLLRDGHAVIEMEDPIDTEFIKKNKIDFMISYGYRHIIRQPVLDFMKDKIVNLHISHLPWNRGADPNLWSFLEDTPKGVTLHFVDEGIDTGDIISQRELKFDSDKETLASTYEKLDAEIIALFQDTWPLIRWFGGGTPRTQQPQGGTIHRVADKRYFTRLLAKGWDTPVSEILGKGSFYLRDVRADDKEAIRQWQNSPDVARYMYTDHHITEEEHERWFQTALREHGRKYWIIMCDREAIGLVNLYDIDEKNRRCLWALYISSENMRSKGVGGFVEYQVMNYVFDDLEYNKLCCEALSSNQRAINFYKSFGFREEGIYRQHMMKNGEYADVVTLAILKSEWDEKKPEIEKKLMTKGLL
ncbi:MAG TPA: UDP-4-amino-4,6-dideoxy-N-acetyl-beta-L-altrosamine N-acetyltransferase [Syntrophus sp. (in: bacteria)]|nr:UDP-4-amino-4,6-dideoxy-N-acetyl-beta-L-altrosamine N-acetyltransferase [Syntrophus sp. (in: bacteria)]